MKNEAFHRRFRYAFAGISEAFRREASFRFQASAAGGVLIVLLITRPQPLWWALLLMCAGSVLACELLNTSLESFLDRLHPEIHPSIRLAKDCAAGAVLVLSFVSLCVFVAFVCDQYPMWISSWSGK